MVMQLTAHLDVGGLIPGEPTLSAPALLSADWGSNCRPTYPRSTALPLDCCAFCSPNRLKPSLQLKKETPNCVFLSASVLARLIV